jgi:serine 3-dehydrogenase
MSMTLKDQVVLVVGASSGIGRETAILFGREGAKVMASARRQERLQELQDALGKEDIAIEIHAADASNPEEMEKLAQHTSERFGKIDILVYTSGTNTPDRALTRLTADIWDAMVSVNLNGAYYITRAVLPAMRERGSGQLIYVSSISGHTPDVSGAAYQASKRGLIGLAHAIRVEEKDHGIRTCAVCPGLVNTEILKFRPVQPPADLLAKALQPEDVAEAVLSVAKMPPRAAVTELTIVPTHI